MIEFIQRKRRSETGHLSIDSAVLSGLAITEYIPVHHC